MGGAASSFADAVAVEAAAAAAIAVEAAAVAAAAAAVAVEDTAAESGEGTPSFGGSERGGAL